MSSAKWQIKSLSSKQTESIAESIGKQLRGGEIIDLIGDLGSGKTTFVRGLARGIGSQATVNSPTFKISNTYRGRQLQLHHFDFYRVVEPGILSSELAEILAEPSSVAAIEWSDVVRAQLPLQQLAISFSQTAEQQRQLDFTYPESLSYLLKDLQ